MTECTATSVVASPAPPLRDLVDSYVGYRYSGFEPGIHVGKPSRHLTLVIDFDGPLRVTGQGYSAAMTSNLTASLGGLHRAPIAIHHDGHQHGVTVLVTATGARRLLGMPAAELASDIVGLDAVLGRRATRLRERLVDTCDWGERFAIVDEVLLECLADRPSEARPEILRAWDRLIGTHGAIGVAALADEVAWSRRHLSEHFRAEFGLTPKLMARVLRFERAVELFSRPGAATLADIAAVCGYADQAHLVRDWRQFTGSSPTAWRAAETLPVDIAAGQVPLAVP